MPASLFAAAVMYVIHEHPDGGLPMLRVTRCRRAPSCQTDDVWTEDAFFWAHAIVLTRSLPFGEDLALIPMLDLANHEETQTPRPTASRGRLFQTRLHGPRRAGAFISFSRAHVRRCPVGAWPLCFDEVAAWLVTAFRLLCPR
eukprot:235971-Pleurochrysis_carterae.AAC.2